MYSVAIKIEQKFQKSNSGAKILPQDWTFIYLLFSFFQNRNKKEVITDTQNVTATLLCQKLETVTNNNLHYINKTIN